MEEGISGPVAYFLLACDGDGDREGEGGRETVGVHDAEEERKVDMDEELGITLDTVAVVGEAGDREMEGFVDESVVGREAGGGVVRPE